MIRTSIFKGFAIILLFVSTLRIFSAKISASRICIRISQQQPQNYYIHKQARSPTTLKYKGSEPTGKLPPLLNFPMKAYKDPENFRFFEFGDVIGDHLNLPPASLSISRIILEDGTLKMHKPKI